jgi:hypothetical protein
MQKNIFKTLGIFTLVILVMSMTGAASACSSHGHNQMYGHNHRWNSLCDNCQSGNDGSHNCSNGGSTNSGSDGSCNCGNDDSNSLSGNDQSCNDGSCSNSGNDDSTNSLSDNDQNVNDVSTNSLSDNDQNVNDDSSNNLSDNDQNVNDVSTNSLSDNGQNVNDVSTNSLSDNGQNVNDVSTNSGNDVSTVSTPSASFVTVNPHEGNTYWVGEDGHQISLINNNSAVNPTYSQLLSFIKEDKTDEQRYIPGEYTCGDFAETVHNNAEKAGYIAGWVTIDGIDHCCNAFQTSDEGMIYIDCTGSPNGGESCDTSVKLENGIEYQPIPLFNKEVNFDSMGIISSYKVYW